MGILRSQVNINDLELIDEQTISGDGVPAMRTNKRAMEAARFVCQNLPLFLLKLI